MIELIGLIAVIVSCIFIVWRVTRDCNEVERIWREANERMRN